MRSTMRRGKSTMAPKNSSTTRVTIAIACLGLCVAFVIGVGLHFVGVLPPSWYKSPLPYVPCVAMLVYAMLAAYFRTSRDGAGLAWEMLVGRAAGACLIVWALYQNFISFVDSV